MTTGDRGIGKVWWAWVVAALLAAPAVGWAEVLEYPELTERATAAISKGCQCLVKTQAKEGYWGTQYKVAGTALSLMAFMVEGHFPGEGKYGKTMARGLDFLLSEARKSSDGYMGVKMYEHGLAVLAFSEMWGMTDRDDAIQEALNRGVRIILRSQHINGGWRYDPQPTEADTSVTVMIVVALASARQAGIVVPDKTIARAVSYLKRAWNPESGGFSYGDDHGAPAFARSAGAAYVLMLSGERESNEVKGGIRYLNNQPQDIFSQTDHYYYGHYYAIQAMVQSGLKGYRNWYPRIRDALILKQASDGHWGESYDTGMAIIVLGTPYRFIPIYQE